MLAETALSAGGCYASLAMSPAGRCPGPGAHGMRRAHRQPRAGPGGWGASRDADCHAPRDRGPAGATDQHADARPHADRHPDGVTAARADQRADGNARPRGGEPTGVVPHHAAPRSAFHPAVALPADAATALRWQVLVRHGGTVDLAAPRRDVANTEGQELLVAGRL